MNPTSPTLDHDYQAMPEPHRLYTGPVCTVCGRTPATHTEPAS